jgi:Flp pilus assembly protein TadG
VCAKPRSRGRRFASDRSGGAALEFALLGPVVLMFVIGFFQVAWAMYCSSSVRYALHNSARALVIDPTISQGQLQQMVRDAVSPLASPNVNVSLVKTTVGTGLQVSQATATYNYQIVIPFMPTYNGSFSTTFVQSGTNY